MPTCLSSTVVPSAARVAIGLTAANAAACERARPGCGEMIAPAVAVDLRRATKLADPQDRRIFQQVAVFEFAT